MKTGKVVLVLGGRFAGRKAVIVKVLFFIIFYIFVNFLNCSLPSVPQSTFFWMACILER